METDWRPEDLTDEQRKDLADGFFQHMIYGILWCVGGVVLTLFTLSMGRVGIVFWGAIVYGIYDFFKGLGGWMKFK